MKRTLLSFFVASAALIAASVANGQAPGVVAESAEPPSAAPAASAAAPSGAATPAGPSYLPAKPAGGSTSVEVEAERYAIWNSPEMREAREWVREYGRRSRRFTTQHAEQFLAQLSQKSAEEMRAWLEKYAARRAALARAAEVEQQARQIAIQQALDRQEATRRSFDTFNLGQSQGALLANERMFNQQMFNEQALAERRAYRDARLADDRAGPDYYSLFVNPPWWVKQRMAAASSVPGDLPAWDPRNFIRGDVPAPVEVGGGPNAGPNGEGAGPNAGPAGPGSASGPNAGPGVGGDGPNSGPGPGGP